MGRPVRYFAVIGSMRTGSNLLQRSLAQFPDLMCHGELFNPAFIDRPGTDRFLGIDRAARDAEPLALIEAMIAAADGRVPGFRIFDDHDRRVLDHVAADPDCARVILRRAPEESFVSLLIAQETGQWLLTDEKNRRTARVAFDRAAFETYRARIERFHDGFSRRMRGAGRTAFDMGYAELRDVALINGLAGHLGSEYQLARIAPTLKRQNPGPLAAHVSNPEALADIPPAAGRRPPSIAPRDFLAMPEAGLVYAPIPGGPEARIRGWLESLGGEIETGLTRTALTRGFAKGRLRLAFSATRHPLARLHEAFVTCILRPRGKGFPRIREALIRDHGLVLPDTALADAGDRAALAGAGYDADAHRAAFAGFLGFLKGNLAGRTLIRIDPLWAPQVDHLAAIGAGMPLRLVIGPEGAASGRHLRELLGLGEGADMRLDAPETQDPVFPLAEIWTPELGRACRDVCRDDHDRLGYLADIPPV